MQPIAVIQFHFNSYPLVCRIYASVNWFSIGPAPSHYQYQWWVIVKLTPRDTRQWNLNQNTKIGIHENAFENSWKYYELTDIRHFRQFMLSSLVSQRPFMTKVTSMPPILCQCIYSIDASMDTKVLCFFSSQEFYRYICFSHIPMQFIYPSLTWVESLISR